MLASSISAIAWLRASQERLRQSIAALANEVESLRPRLTNWGERQETRWIIAVMIQHDLYLAGKVNYLPSLRQGTDRWAYEAAGE